MIEHPEIEELSSWLDERLPEGEASDLAAHLAQCDACRRRADGLDRVRRRLAALERVAPRAELPPALGSVLGGEGWRRRRPPVLSIWSPIATGVFVLLGLGVILLWFSQQSARRLEETVATATATAAQVRSLAGREFRLVAGAWTEAGVAADAPRRSVAADEPLARELYASVPGLAEAVARGERWVLHWRGETVELTPPAQRKGSMPASE